MKIGYATADWSSSIVDENGHPVWGGAGWARMGQYHGRLPYETVAGRLIGNGKIFGVQDWEGKNHMDCNVIVMQRCMHVNVAKDMEVAKKNGQFVINDLDDLFWKISKSHIASHIGTHPDENYETYKDVLSGSSLVIVSTPHLYDEIRKWIKCPVMIVPNFIDFNRFSFRIQQERPTVGWVGGTHVRSNDLEELQRVLPQLQRTNGWKVHHSGHLEDSHTNNGGKTFHVRSFADITGAHDVSTLPLVSPSEYPSVFTFDVGVVPLSDQPFNYSKSNIKGLEYVANKIPFVASDVGEYTRAKKNLDLGLTAKKPADWLKRLKSLDSVDARCEEAERNYEIAQTYSIENGITLYSEIYRIIEDAGKVEEN